MVVQPGFLGLYFDFWPSVESEPIYELYAVINETAKTRPLVNSGVFKHRGFIFFKLCFLVGLLAWAICTIE